MYVSIYNLIDTKELLEVQADESAVLSLLSTIILNDSNYTVISIDVKEFHEYDLEVVFYEVRLQEEQEWIYQ